MLKDEAIEEIRTVREQISEQYEHDVTRFLNHYRELDKKYQQRPISKTTPKHQQTHNEPVGKTEDKKSNIR